VYKDLSVDTDVNGYNTELIEYSHLCMRLVESCDVCRDLSVDTDVNGYNTELIEYSHLCVPVVESCDVCNDYYVRIFLFCLVCRMGCFFC
jgi:hypothetical protein